MYQQNESLLAGLSGYAAHQDMRDALERNIHQDDPGQQSGQENTKQKALTDIDPNNHGTGHHK